jgi:peptidoglycan/LPS O-acetylase OafA/YrhL
LGMGVAVLAAAGVRLPGRWALALWGAAIAGWLALGAAGGVPGSTDVERALIGHTAKGLIAVAVLAPAVLAPPAAVRPLAAPALRWVGMVSYGVYLWHLAWIEQLDRWAVQDAVGTPGFTVAATAGALLLGWASWELVERPAIAFGRRLEDRMASRPPRESREAEIVAREYGAP